MTDALLYLFNFVFGETTRYLTSDLNSYAPTVNATMENLNQFLCAIAYGILPILTLWNIVRNTTSFVELKKPEVLFKVFLRFILTKYLIGSSFFLTNAIFGTVVSITEGVMNATGYTAISWPITPPASSWWEDILNAVTTIINPLSKVPGMLIGLIMWIIGLVLCVTLLLTVIGRLFKIYLFAAIAPLPLCAVGSDSTQDIGKNFLKGYLAVCLEGFIILISMIIFSAWAGMDSIFGDIDSIFSWLGDAAGDIGYSFSLIFNMLLLLAIIKGTDRVIHRIFGI